MAQNPKDWLVVVNPNAGIGKVGKDWGRISRLLDKHAFAYQAVFTEGPGHAIDLVAESVGDGTRKIIAVGGDGTMNEVANGIFKQKEAATTDITVGMISVGTGNDWVRTYEIPMEYEKAIQVLSKEYTILQDAGIVSYYNSSYKNQRYFVNMAGLGFDGLVAQKTNADKQRGKGNPLLYIKHLLKSLFSYKSSNTILIVDGKEVKGLYFSMGIGIGKYNGGGMKQAPDAIPDDGLFDLTLIKDLSKWSIVTNVRRLYDGTIKKYHKVETLLGKKIEVACKTPILLEADGESLGHSPFSFDIIPQSIRVVVNEKKWDQVKRHAQKTE